MSSSTSSASIAATVRFLSLSVPEIQMPYTRLSDVGPGQADQTVCVRLSRLCHHRGGVRYGPVNEIQMVLLNEEGSSMYVVVERGNIQEFEDVLHEGNTYEISRFHVVSHATILRPVEATYML